MLQIASASLLAGAVDLLLVKYDLLNILGFYFSQMKS